MEDVKKGKQRWVTERDQCFRCGHRNVVLIDRRKIGLVSMKEGGREKREGRERERKEKWK